MKKHLTSLIKSGYGLAVLVICLLLTVSTLGFYYFELRGREDAGFFSALYWAVVTLTTVGYGDLVPHSLPGRVLGLVVMLSGIGLVSMLSGNLASFLVERNTQKRKGLLQMRLTGHVIILGWNSYAPKMIKSYLAGLADAEQDVVIVGEMPENRRDEIAYQLDLGDRLHFVFGATTQENVIQRASPDTAEVVYILRQAGLASGEADQQSIYTALTVRSLAPKVTIYSEVMDRNNHEHLKRAGVNEIISGDDVASRILGLMGATPSVWPFFQTLFGLQGGSRLTYRRLSTDEKTGEWRHVFQDERDKTGALPLALCREPKNLSLDEVLDEGSALDSFIMELFAASGRSMEMGQQSAQVLVNPADEIKLAQYDGVLSLKPCGAPGRDAA